MPDTGESSTVDDKINSKSHSNNGQPSPSYSPVSATVLPTELYETFNYVHFLHSLAVNPESVLPPGKSLLSVLSKPFPHQDPSQTSELRERVETIVHKAFWDEALESLQNPAASVQLSRLKRLYADLLTALTPLLPAHHAVLTVLSDPLPPTSFPLRSVLRPLQDALRALRTRCAPIHDQQIDSLLSALDDPLDADLPEIVVTVTRDVLGLCEQMKEDLAQFVLGTMGEDQLRVAITQEAVVREEEFIYRLWGQSWVHESWKRWLSEDSRPGEETQETLTNEERFIWRLIQALTINHAVSCPLPMTFGARAEDEQAADEPPQPPPFNKLPPALLFITPALLYIQNYLQALVIAASLRALVRLPTSSGDPTTPTDGLSEYGFEERVWMLLKADIDEEPSLDGTKLINLADEAVAAARLSHAGNLDPEEEARLRASVDRTLQPNDPVFSLLQRRLVHAIQTHLTSPGSQGQNESSSSPAYILRSGRSLPGAVSRNRPPDHKAAEVETGKLVVKGFDHPVLVTALSDVLFKLQKCIDWTERVWQEPLLRDAS